MSNTLPGVPEPSQDLPPLLVSQPKAARLLDLSERTVYALRKTGQLQTVRVGDKVLLRYSDLVAFAAGRGAGLSSDGPGGDA